LRQVSLEIHHTFGAIGYSEEHEAPRHFRRIHGDLVRFGGPTRAREELARYLIDEGEALPDYDLGVEGNGFRMEVRKWMEENWFGTLKKAYDASSFHERGECREYAAKMAEQNWHAVARPKEYGGQGRSPMEQLAFIEEIQRADAPSAGRGEIQAMALMAYGSEEQKATFLPKLKNGEISFCLGYSEPGSGSDLASLKTTAVLDGNEWVINGQKLWTTGAEKADYMWLAARTDPNAKPKHAGISLFIVPMKSAGITVRPSMAMYGHTFCAEFLNDVRIAESALVGEINGGWKILTSALATERIITGRFVSNVRANFERLLTYVRGTHSLANSKAIRDRVGMLAAEIEVARQLLMNSIAMVDQGKVPVHEAAMSKVFTGELMERLGDAALHIGGTGMSLSEGANGAITNGRLEQMPRQSIMMVVGGGTAEVQRTLIVLHGLHLPR
jgi:3-oxo-4-pregnene-20-carboxyl-CoA dehydrogenase beta subunit